MRILIFLFFLLSYGNLFSQDTIYNMFPPVKDGVLPQFKEGEFALYEFLANNIHYPLMAKQSGIQGRIFVTFIVEKDGSVNEVALLKGIGGGCDEEALRVVKMMNGMWLPGTIKGMPVRVRYNLPVKFTLQDGADKSDASVSYNKGLNLMKEEKYDKAISYFAFYLPGANLYPDAVYATGMCRYMLNDLKGAINDWEAARNEGIPDCDNKLAQAYFKLGNQYHQEKKYPVAIACYTKSLELVPDVNVLFNRGISYLYLGEKEKACDDWHRVVELGSDESLPLIQEYCE